MTPSSPLPPSSPPPRSARPRQFVADGMARLLAVAEARQRRESPFAAVPADTAPVTVPTRHGDMPATLYRPRTADTARGVYVNVHGGGFSAGAPAMDDSLCRYLAHEAGVFVVNVDYRRTPHARFPVPVEQVYDALVWAADGARPWAGAALLVGGQSAGGSLAAAACRTALTDGGPEIALQVLQYPPLDLVTPARSKAAPTDHEPMLRPSLSQFLDAAYVPDPRQRTDPRVSPAWGANSDDITGIAPAVLVTAGRDRLRAEGLVYAARLAHAGALVAHHDLPDVDHGYDITGENPEVTKEMYAVLAAHVRRAATP
ncbi:alpha/beta hydrolase fold domain-containing protein [Streptomyces sp. NPDC058417]|uniref:alpha/beta hydrolase fold domain-containing protein n=1 Tax=unclassified Streptomyces TaxID=2593676 RepID=UPI003668918C